MRAERNGHRRFQLGVVVSAYAALAMVIALNVVVDPYRVFRVLNWGSGYTDNERFNKIAHLIEHPARHDAFIVGSSRMGVYEPSQLDAARPGRSYYNLSTFGGSAGDVLTMLVALKGNNVAVDEIYFGVDLFPFLSQDSEVTPAYRHHPEASGESFASFYASYLLLPSVRHALMKVRQARLEAPDVEFDFEGRGRFFLHRWDSDIESDHEAFVERQFGPHRGERPAARDVVWSEARFVELAALVAWVESEGVSLHLFVQPHHRRELERFSADALSAFEQRILELGRWAPSFLDDDRWVDDDRLYYETKHFRPIVARQVVEAYFDEPVESRSGDR